MNKVVGKNQKRTVKRDSRGKLVGANESADGNTPSTKMFLEVNDEQLDEADIIISPALLGKGDRSFKSRHDDHEVAMARNDCFQSAANAARIFKMLQNVSEAQGIDGWVASKLTLAADYLNTVREYLEGQNLQHDLGEGTNKRIKGGDPCRDKYKMVGMKQKGGRPVPNCVPSNPSKKKKS